MENIAHERLALEKWRDELTEAQQKQAAEAADLEHRRQEVIRLEAEAKAGFAQAQKDSFKEVIEKRLEELDARQKDLDALEKRIAADLAKVTAKEGEVAKRELTVTEREQKADAGFADKAAVLAKEAKRQHEANQQQADLLKERTAQLSNEKNKLEKAKEALRQREQAVAEAERQRDSGYTDARTALDAELNGKRSAWQDEAAQQRADLQKELTEKKAGGLASLEAEMTVIREKRFAEITAAEEQERARIRKTADDEAKRIQDEVAKERKDWEKKRTDQQENLKKQAEANEKKAAELSAKEDSLLGKERELQLIERHLEEQGYALEKMVEERIAERKASYEQLEEGRQEEISRLRDSLQIQTDLVGAFEHLKRQLGDKDPAEVLRDLNTQSDELKRHRDELAKRPSEEIRERYKAQEAEIKKLKADVEKREQERQKIDAQLSETQELRRKNSELEADLKVTKNQKELFEDAANEYKTELDRLRAAYKRPAETADFYKEIEKPLIPANKITFFNKDKKQRELKWLGNLDELEWLNNISNACDQYGLHFSPRILKSFHTALKTAEWSPLTILAGVSGTGKSELPRLYSHFGGLMFQPLSVQPNWDCQESMLGFFNPIDNCFCAQPVLQFLVQSQKEWTDEYPGLSDAVCLVLLDEINLAHPELYFAGFLSKLEQRRGMKATDVPSLPVNISSREKYPLPLGRNVLWTGTMNQDETTKSLSDKVLDRSIVIHFPRPTQLKRREKLTPLDNMNRSPLLRQETFFSWVTPESTFTDEQIKPYKDFIEEINKSLGVAGRAIGHRVWQSVEYYMMNYPDVRAALKNSNDEATFKKAMHVAFEDQLVQKVMPKLRGIDTRGKSKSDCLDKIRGQLSEGIDGMPFNLLTDFDLACELGYGQFIWQSANYLGNDENDAEGEKPVAEPPAAPEESPDKKPKSKKAK